MKIAIPIWENSISSVFDFASQLLVIDLKNGSEVSRDKFALTEQSTLERAARLRQLGIDIVICAAISRRLDCMLRNSEIKVLPFVTGSTEQILEAYLADKLSSLQYTQPQCWRGRGNGPGMRKGRCGRNKF